MRIDLMVMCGLPRSGKSTYARKLMRDEIVVLCPDDFRKILTGKNFHGPAEEMVWSHVKIATRALLPNYTVLIDATAITRGSRSQWVSMAKELGKDCKPINFSITCYAFLTTFAECLRRNGKAERFVPDFIMEQQAEKFSIPTTEEGFTYIEYLAGDGSEMGSTSIDPDDGSLWLDGRAEELIALGNPYTVKEFLHG